MVNNPQSSPSAVPGQKIPIFLNYEGQKTNFYEVILQIFAAIDVLHSNGIAVSNVNIQGLPEDLRKRVFDKLKTFVSHKVFKREAKKILNKNPQLKSVYDEFKIAAEGLVETKLKKSEAEQTINSIVAGVVADSQKPLDSPLPHSINDENIDNKAEPVDTQEDSFIEDFLEIIIEKGGPETDDAFMNLLELGFVEFEKELEKVGLNLKTVFKATGYEYSQREFANREYINWLIYLFYGSRENMPTLMDNMIEIRNRLFMAMIK